MPSQQVLTFDKNGQVTSPTEGFSKFDHQVLPTTAALHRFLFMPVAVLWLILMALLTFVLLPVVDGHVISTPSSLQSLANTTGAPLDFLGNPLIKVPKLSCDIDVCDLDDDLCESDLTEDGKGHSPASGNTESRRTYEVQFSSGNTLSITAQDYPSRGDLFNGEAGKQVLRAAFEPVISYDCANIDLKGFHIAENAAGPPANTVTEHIVEVREFDLKH